MKKHQDESKCSINECKLCGRLNKNIYVLTEHLRCHSRAAFFVNDQNKDMDSDDIEDMQKELNQKPVSQIRKRGPYKKVKLYECDPSTSSDESDDDSDRKIIGERKYKSQNDIEENNGWGSDENDSENDESNDRTEFKQTESDGNLTPTRQNPYNAGIPLQQFPPEEVQQALTDAMRPFYNARRCPQCAFLTKNIASLQRHIQPCHKEIYDKWCNDCNKIVENIKEHKKLHREDLLKCPFCGACRKSRDHLKKHLANHCSSDRKLIHGAKWYSCDKCPCSYPDESDYKNHICTEEPSLRLYTYKPNHIKDETIESIHVVKKTETKRKYTKKLLKSGWKNRRLFPFCVFCKKTVRSLQDHLVLKHGYEPTESKKRPSRFEEPHLGKEKVDIPETIIDNQEYRGPKCTKFRFCNICKRNVRYIRDHMKRFHSDLPKRSYLCSACGKTFVSSTSLQAHTKFVHNSKPSELPLKCSTCGKILGNLATLKVHEKLHVTKKSHACHLCGVCFIDNSQLRSHLKTHIGEDHGPVYCSVCNKKFLRPALLELHMQKFHTGKDPYKCMICFKVLTRMGSLKQHMKYVHGEHEDLKCKYCGKELRSPGTLKKHELIHIGVKPYKCSVCSFSCRQSNGLTSHMKQHPEDLPQENCPHKCAFCYRRFNTKAMLTSHISLRHKNEQMMQKEN